jgi:hypothetical protein
MRRRRIRFGLRIDFAYHRANRADSQQPSGLGETEGLTTRRLRSVSLSSSRARARPPAPLLATPLLRPPALPGRFLLVVYTLTWLVEAVGQVSFWLLDEPALWAMGLFVWFDANAALAAIVLAGRLVVQVARLVHDSDLSPIASTAHWPRVRPKC